MAEKKICIFGDSIVWGACDTERGGWVERLKVYIANKCDYDISIYNCGVSGENTEKLKKRIKNESQAREFTDAIIAIGINDTQHSNRGIHRVNENQFKNNLKAIITFLNKKRTLFIGITNVDEPNTTPIIYDKKKNYRNSEIRKYNTILEEFCRLEKIKFLPVPNLNANDFYDGLHPNSEGHKKLYAYIKKNLELMNYFKI